MGAGGGGGWQGADFTGQSGGGDRQKNSRVRHAGAFAALEDEMCDFGLDGFSSGRSPDRLDALVWAITALSYGARAEPRVRGV
jgi:phage terminase large subunit-like protein